MRIGRLPRLYAILDSDSVRAAGFDLLDAARGLRVAGVKLLQYRNKTADGERVLRDARAIKNLFEGTATILILNDSPLLTVEAGWDGVHVGQTDSSVEQARACVGPDRLIGVSTHSTEQFRQASAADADYIAFGPIFGTATKSDAMPEVGLEGLESVRPLRTRPLVAIGGISEARMRSVYQAGADSVALISALFSQGLPVEKAARRLLRIADSDEQRTL